MHTAGRLSGDVDQQTNTGRHLRVSMRRAISLPTICCAVDVIG
jgi:hypothetical protein